MARQKHHHTQDTRILTNHFQIGVLLGRSEGWVRKRMEEFEKTGFPLFDELLCGWDAKAIHQWIDGRSGLLASSGNAINPWDEG